MPLMKDRPGQAPAVTEGRAQQDLATQKANALTGMSYEEGRAALSPRQVEEPSSFITDLFARIDRNKDKGIDRKEVIAHLKAVKIGGGFLGLVHKKTADKFLEYLDTDKSGKVTWAEFQNVATQVMPASLFDEQGNIKPALVDQVYAELDRNADGRVNRKELEKGADKQLPEDTSFRGTIIEVAGKLGLDALDLNKDGFITKLELQMATQAVAKLKAERDAS
jgi:Ca2+-binding EF-hand superfamily protein